MKEKWNIQGLNQLIDTIQKDGIDAAEEKKTQLLREARDEADKILKQARDEADGMIQDAKDQQADLTRQFQDSLQFAFRDTLLTLEQALLQSLKSMSGQWVESQLQSEVIHRWLDKLIELWWEHKQDYPEMSVLISVKEGEGILAALQKDWQKELKEGLQLDLNPEIQSGFRVRLNEDNAYFEFSRDILEELLTSYLSQKFKDLLKFEDALQKEKPG